MGRRWLKQHRPLVTGAAMLLALLAGHDPARSLPLTAPVLMRSVAVSGAGGVPQPPKAFALPAQPIAAASSDGYLPSSWAVTPKGEFTLTLPLNAPPGRAGMAPALSLDYASRSADSLAGQGWSLGGLSTITRGGRSWARHGTTSGTRFDADDRFYLDGQELVDVDGSSYGSDGAEYRTEPDTFVRVRSFGAQPNDPLGPEEFTVELGDGRVRTYAAVTAERLTFAADNTAFKAEPVRAQWRLVSERDANGNTISYEYQDSAGPGGANASEYWFESVPSKIYYTANMTQGLPTHGLQDLPWRWIALEYEPRPDVTTAWLGGVQRRFGQRLKTVRMYAPNPTATAEVWRYDLAYTTGSRAQSLLASVQRCESAGGCLWAKEFTYAAGSRDLAFSALPKVPAPIADYDLSVVAAPNGEVPALQMLDANGDGASDLLFGPGTTKLWETYHSKVLNAELPDGTFLGGGHSLWLSARDGNGVIAPLSQGLSLPRDEEPLSTAKYGHVRLDQSTAVDIDGDGRDELVAKVDNSGAAELNLPPEDRCSVADFKWTGGSFVHVGKVPCTLLAETDTVYRFYLPNEFPLFADVDGDGLPDRASIANNGGWIGSNNPNDATATFEYSPVWQVALNTRAQPGTFAAPAVDPDVNHRASPGIVTDLDGDGRAELTSGAERSSLMQTAKGQWTVLTPASVPLPLGADGKPVEGYREFGDFNGDGTEDEMLLSVTDAASPGTFTGRIFWNTGRGFYADDHTVTVPLDVHPDRAKNIATRYEDPGLHVTDIDNDGRMDLAVFNNDHRQGNQAAPEILFFLSQGNGTFASVALPVSAGTRDDVKYAIDGAMRPFEFDQGRLENDTMRLEIEAFGQLIPGSQVLLQLVPYADYLTRGDAEKTPGFAAGWNLATLADVSGDGWIDIVRHVGGNDPSAGFEVLAQVPRPQESLVAVTDAATAWPALSVQYADDWSDRPEVDDSYSCTYPLVCPKSGLSVVRQVTSRLGLTDLAPGDDPLTEGRTWQYSYRDPVASAQGLGFFGFSEVRSRDMAPDHPMETITTYDLRTPDASGRFYPGVGVPATVTTARPILKPGEGQPANAPARLTRTHYTYEWRALNGGATHALLPESVHTSTWEQTVALAWSGSGPDHLFVAGYAEPANPPIHVDTGFVHDDYGNLVDVVTATAKGIKTETKTPATNDIANWQLGLVSEHTTETLESAKNAVAVWRTTAYTYTPKGQLETITTEPYAADATLTAVTTLTYDDYGLLTSATTATAGEAPRTVRADSTTLWPGAPEEHLYTSTVWAEHDDPACTGDCRPATWTLNHPAYGVPIATMDRNGVQTTLRYDAHGRWVSAVTDGGLALSATYAGRPDTYGGLNGLAMTTTRGLQQGLETRNAEGNVLRRSLTGFDGGWINTFMTYDELGRRTGVSRPSAGVPSAWTTFDYDSLGRTVASTAPDGSRTEWLRQLLKTTVTDPAGHVSTYEEDVDGRLIRSATTVDGQDVATTYDYAATPIGPKTIVTDDQGHATTTQYDVLGRAVSEDDPSRGLTKAAYNGFGERLETRHEASGAIETDTYDDLGRLVTATTPDGLTTYAWDTASNGLGRLARATSPDQIRTEYRYDALGRLAGMDQTDARNATASIDIGYDAQTGRLASLDYPQVPGEARLRIAYGYNGYGYLTTVSSATSQQPPTVLQEITARNADLALVDAVRGNGAIDEHRDYDPLTGRLWTMSAMHAGVGVLTVDYGYDADGLVGARTRTDETVQIEETFTHDALHRLTQSTQHGQPLPSGTPFAHTLEETYDSVGNRIDTRRDGKIVEHRHYGDNGASPYALTTRTLGDPAQPNAPSLTYEYDTKGRLRQDPRRRFAWTAFDLPSRVTQDGRTWAFAYAAGGERVMRKGPDETVTTLAGVYEKHESHGVVKHVFHVGGNDGPVADLTYVEATPPMRGTWTVTYPLVDALGSVDAVADASGAVREEDYYDAWGRRGAADGTPLETDTFQSLSSVGFADGMHEEALGLIDLRGRIYDPALGRFLSPDPVTGRPAFSESWNAYSYVLNSPLDYRDPSGLDPCPAGFVCETAPGNEITNTIQYAYGAESWESSEAAAEIDAAADATTVASSVAGGAFAFMLDQHKLAEQQRADAVRKGRALPDGTPIRSADGTTLPRRSIDTRGGNRVVDSWGWPVRGGVHGPINHPKEPPPQNTDGKVAKSFARVAVRLTCGKVCPSANAPTDAREAANAPRQLSAAQNLQNAYEQARAVFDVKSGKGVDLPLPGPFRAQGGRPSQYVAALVKLQIKRAIATRIYDRILSLLKEQGRLEHELDEAEKRSDTARANELKKQLDENHAQTGAANARYGAAFDDVIDAENDVIDSEPN